VFAVLGASGNTGRVVAETLLSQNKKVRVVVRDVAKGHVWKEAGAEGGSGKRVIELAGPREYSPRDVAAALARVVGKPIAVQEAPEDAMEPALAAAGMNAEWTRLFKELTHGLNTGIVVWEGGHPLWRGEMDIQTVLSALLGK
jgi:uncharacterized protein YbjT (DUF2867 family)